MPCKDFSLNPQENPKLDTKTDKYIDESILDELEEEGFFQKIAASN